MFGKAITLVLVFAAAVSLVSCGGVSISAGLGSPGPDLDVMGIVDGETISKSAASTWKVIEAEAHSPGVGIASMSIEINGTPYADVDPDAGQLYLAWNYVWEPNGFYSVEIKAEDNDGTTTTRTYMLHVVP